MRYVRFTTVILFGTAMLLGAYQIESSVFIPPTYYVGDRVELRLQLRLEDAEILAVSEVPDIPSFRIHDIQIRQSDGEAEVRVFFSPFQVGSHTLPKLDLGKVVLDDIRVHTSSILNGANEEITSLQRQAVLPDTPLVITIIFGILLMIPFVIWFLRKQLLPGIAGMVRKIRQYWPYHQLLVALRSLDADAYDADIRDFYFRLSREYRLFLSRTLAGVSMTASTTEIRGALTRFSLPGPLADSVGKMLLQFDIIKFGGKMVSDLDKKRDVSKIKTSAEKLRAAILQKERG